MLAPDTCPEEGVPGLPCAPLGPPTLVWMGGWASCSGGQTPEKGGQGPFILVIRRETASGDRLQEERLVGQTRFRPLGSPPSTGSAHCPLWDSPELVPSSRPDVAYPHPLLQAGRRPIWVGRCPVLRAYSPGVSAAANPRPGSVSLAQSGWTTPGKYARAQTKCCTGSKDLRALE